MDKYFAFREFSALKKILFLLLFFIIGTFFFFQFQQEFIYAQVAPVKIMVVGDSISQGHSGDYTWRYRLWQHLASSGAAVDFVGPKQTVYDNNTTNSVEYLDPNFDRDHDATWGRPVVYEKDTIASEVGGSNPDILLINLGTNDLIWFGLTGEQTASEMTTLIANARSAKSDIKIVLSKITPRAGVDANYLARWSDYNVRISSLAASLSTATSPIIVADPVTGFDPAVDTYDNTHPSPSGEYKIAAAFANALASGLGLGTTYRSLPQAPSWPSQTPSLAITPGSGQATITWTLVPGAEGYYIYMRNVTRGESLYRLPYAIAGPTFTGGYLINGETYEFAVSTKRGNIGDSVGEPMSNKVQVVPNVPLLPGPTGLIAAPLNNGVQLNWNPVGSSWFYIYMRNVTRGESFVRLLYPATTNAFTGGYMINGETYEFKVTTINSANKEGPFSSTVSVVPAAPLVAPSGITVTAGVKKATVSWASVTGATAYQVWIRQGTTGSFTKSVKITAPMLTATIPSLTTGSTYYFTVSSINESGIEGVVSAQVKSPVIQ